MTYPVPDRLVPIQREVFLTEGTHMLAIIAAICFILAFFGVDIDAHDLVPLGMFFLALHFVVPVALPARRA